MPSYAGIYFQYFDPNRPALQWLPQVSLSSVTKLYHTASRTLLTQTFINPSIVSPIPSAKYAFPLYESCAIVAFRCYVGRRLIEGIIKEKEDASATYQAAVERNEPASLLEQHTADVFTTSIGNISAGETVKVEIEYIMELKHDAEVDGLRFTIPTSIAPRYGALPSGLSTDEVSRAVTPRNMNISVQVSMSSSIKFVQVCPSNQH
jgi:Vault protein inter-alpha-trypsin domain